ncbi:Vacuolar protein sorting-associated protein 52 A [Golovinomyces cichoracearum]|uniref:Vacuolar protein sorting-associated protein 52 A n=1 Tax=Golovinomyces cichoracearum TaxID=62708 RepID=A0A420IF46_9PEZI|nr:Vacuolar protein sorting-associated protein 52 A [Golovinomyces cichoracearum]
MWLDRLAGHAMTPATTSVPARQQNTHYVSNSSQKSSLAHFSSVNINKANPNSLPATKTITDSSMTPTLFSTDSSESQQVLKEILVCSDDEQSYYSLEENSEDTVHDDLEFEVNFEGLSLRQIAESPVSILGHDSTIALQATEEYKKDRSRLEKLHSTICSCDEVLSSVESNLITFREELALVSAEIEIIQARSKNLSISLDNRKNAEHALSPIIEEISISPATVKKIVDGFIDEAWVRAMADIDKKLKALDTKIKDQRNIKGIINLKPLLNNLVYKAIERIRDFFVAQIKVLRSPNINTQIVQQQYFIRNKDMYTFLHNHHPQLAEEISQAYINTMRWYFLNQFTRYEKSLSKIKVHLINKNFALGHDDGTRISTPATSLKSSGSLHEALNLGRRIDLLKTSNQNAIPSFLAEEDQLTHYLEYPFRNFNLALIDNASAEFTFLTNFFTPAIPYSNITRHFSYIFEPTFSLGQAFIKSMVSDTYDCLGILICVRLNQNYAFELQRRKVPALESYTNGTSMILWPRFQLIMDYHCESLRVLTSSLSTRKPTASEVAKLSLAPHFMTQRFGQFLSSILQLSVDAGDDEPVSNSLGRLRVEVDRFLNKHGLVMEKKKKDRFMFNNYSLVLTIVSEAQGKLAAEQREYFEEMKKVFGVGVN